MRGWERGSWEGVGVSSGGRSGATGMVAGMWRRVEVIWRSERLLGVSVLVLCVWALCCVGMMFLDGRTLGGVNVWVKPSKFAASIAVFLGTMMWLLGRFSLTEGERSFVRWSLWVTMWLELLPITLQAGRGVRSHFNQSSLFGGLLFMLMGLAIAYMTIVMSWLTWQAFRREHPMLGPVMLGAVRWGLVIFLVGSVAGGIMSKNLAHSVGVADGGPGLPYLGWSVLGGDLRVSHFLGLHALQLLPLWGGLALWGERQGWVREPQRWVVSGSLLLGGLVIAVMVQALLGIPLWSLRVGV